MAAPSVQTFGKYQILERIATGGMAEIYKARLEGIGGFQRTFAIKRVLPHLSQNADYVAMLVDEAKVAGLLSHANIVQILDLGQVEGIWYIAMEYVHGRDLGAVLKRCRERGLKLPVPHTVFTAIELLKGLEYAHQRQVMRGGRPVPLNIIHRDVSPPNILLSFQGEVKLTDFGIARASLKVMETQAGVIKGRFDYMSPEQAAGAKDLDQRSDLFSVGVVLYEMLTGVHPFRAESELTTLENVRIGRYEPLSSRNPDIPFTLETIVDRALRAERGERYATATAFKEALDKFFHDAGFIFTHSTLAAYVKGLFPDVELPMQSPQAAAGFEPADEDGMATEVALDDMDLDAETDGPTKVMDRRILDEPVTKARSATPGRFGFTPSEDPTQVRRSPLLASEGGWGEEPETVIKRHPAEAMDFPDAEAPPTVITNSIDSNEAEFSTILRKRPNFREESRGSSAGRVGLIVVGTGIVMGFLGLVIGVVLGVTGARLLWKPLPTATEVLSTGAHLHVVAPEGAKLKINDVPLIETDIAIAAGRQEVTVELEGYEPFVEQITFAPGEQRVLVIGTTDLKKEKGPR